MFHPQGPTFLELARQALSSTQRGYDLLAPKFDFTPFRTPREMLDAIGPWISEAKSIDTVLDVCCGTGAALEMLRPLCRERLVGIDFSQGMLDVAHRRTAIMPGDCPVELIQANVLDVAFTPEFDLAVCFGGLGHFIGDDQQRLVDQMYRALKPGGRFVFISAHKPSYVSLSYWLARGFNAAMHVRNALVRPPFVMFYLTFLVAEARTMLEAAGFQVQVHENVFDRVFQRACLVVATKSPGVHPPAAC